MSSFLPGNKLNESKKPILALLCVFLHIFLVLLHLVIFALGISGVEHHLVTSESGAWMTALSASTQAFYAVRASRPFEFNPINLQS